MEKKVNTTFPNILAVKNENGEVQKMSIVTMTRLVYFNLSLYLAILNTCKTNEVYDGSYCKENIEAREDVCKIKLEKNDLEYLKNLPKDNTIINLIEMLTTKIIPLNINCVGKCDHDFENVDIDEDRSIIKKFYKDIKFSEYEEKYSYEKLPINLSTDGKRLVVFINNGSNEYKKIQTNNGERKVKQRHSFMPEKILLLNLRRFFIKSSKYEEKDLAFLYDIFIKENDEIDILVDNNNNIKICNENDELNENGQKILNSLIEKFPKILPDTIEGHLKNYVKKYLSNDIESYNIENLDLEYLDEEIKGQLNDGKITDKYAKKKQATKNFIYDIISSLLFKFNKMESDVPLEIFPELQDDLLVTGTIIDNDSFAAIHFFQCIVYACFMHYLNAEPKIRKIVIMNSINLRDELSKVPIGIKEIESKLNQENPFDYMVKKIYFASPDNSKEAKSKNIADILEIKNKAKIFYTFLFPQNLDHATQFNFFDFDNNNRTYNDGIILNDGRLAFPLAKLYEIFLEHPMNSGTEKIADGSEIIPQNSEIEFWHEEVPINALKDYQLNFISTKDIVDNINSLKEKLNHLNSENSCRCLYYIQRHGDSEGDKKQKFSIFFDKIPFLISDLSGKQIFNWYKYINIQYFNTASVNINNKKELIECISKMNNPSREFIEKTIILFNRETTYLEIQKNFYNNLFQKIVQAQNSKEFESYFASEIFINENFQERFLEYLNGNKKNRAVCCLIVNQFSNLFFEKYSNILSGKDICDIYLNIDAELFLNCNDYVFLSFTAYFNDNFDKLNKNEITEISRRLGIKINKFPESIDKLTTEEIYTLNEVINKESLICLSDENVFTELIAFLQSINSISYEFLQKIFYVLLEKNEFYNAIEPTQILEIIQYCDCSKNDKLPFLISYADKLDSDNEKIFYELLVEKISEFYVTDIFNRLPKIKDYLKDEQVKELQKKYDEENTKSIEVEQSEISVDNVDNSNSELNKPSNENVEKDSEDNSEIDSEDKQMQTDIISVNDSNSQPNESSNENVEDNSEDNSEISSENIKIQTKTDSINDLNSLQKETLDENLSKNNKWLDKLLIILGFVFILASPFGFFASLTFGISLLISLVLLGSASVVLGCHLKKRYKENSTPKNLKTNFNLGKTQVNPVTENVIETDPNPKKSKDTIVLS